MSFVPLLTPSSHPGGFGSPRCVVWESRLSSHRRAVLGRSASLFGHEGRTMQVQCGNCGRRADYVESAGMCEGCGRQINLLSGPDRVLERTTTSTPRPRRWLAKDLTLGLGTVALLATVALVAYAVGWPSAMTAARAEALAAKGVHPGQSRSEVEAWLAAQGVPREWTFRPTRTCYGVLHRREDVTFPGWWMPCRGSQTVAECAGLRVDAVHSVVCLCYPASASLLGQTEVTVYFFFDKNERLIRHWADEFTISL
jgi:uncharacterized OB-fold protein